MNTVKLKTECGDIVGLDNGSYVEFRGIKYADAGRWEYPVVTDGWDGAVGLPDGKNMCKVGYMLVAC